MSCNRSNLSKCSSSSNSSRNLSVHSSSMRSMNSSGQHSMIAGNSTYTKSPQHSMMSSTFAPHSSAMRSMSSAGQNSLLSGTRSPSCSMRSLSSVGDNSIISGNRTYTKSPQPPMRSPCASFQSDCSVPANSTMFESSKRNVIANQTHPRSCQCKNEPKKVKYVITKTVTTECGEYILQ